MLDAKIQTGQQPNKDVKNSQGISFMIFRTGSVLIVGKCTEDILNNIYEFLKNLLQEEDEQVGIDLAASGWDSEMIACTCVFEHNGNTYMLYNGNNCGKTGIGYAIMEKT